jgi:hypothetical protein
MSLNFTDWKKLSPKMGKLFQLSVAKLTIDTENVIMLLKGMPALRFNSIQVVKRQRRLKREGFKISNF